MLISLENISFGYKDETLFSDVNFTLSEGEKVGFIGGNGEGKTTLLRLIYGELAPVSGKIFLKNGIRIGYLEQTGGFDSDKTVYEEMCAVFAREREAIDSLREVENRIAKLTSHEEEYRNLSAKYERLNRLIAATDGYNYEVRVRTVLNGMGFEKYYDRVISTMSGGEKTKLKFCKLLLEQPDILFLDEPTNHLDVKTLFWLEEYLQGYKGALFVVSHDRYFLDKIVGKILELENKTVREYKGNYSKYKLLKAEFVATQEKQYEKQQTQIAHMQEYVDKNLVRASTAKMAQSRRTALEKMDRLEKPYTPPAPPRFRFTYSEKPYEQVLQIKDLSLTAGEKKLFSSANAVLRRGEKCALVGDNGTGKSTLLKEIVFGRNESILLGRTVKIAYYDQENSNLKGSNSVLAELWERHSLSSQTEIRATLARVGLIAEDMEKPVSALSGGERAKLALAVFESEHGNFLVLDEPTNHLDLQARESLEEALKAFDGTVLFVSHDRYFIGAIADKVMEIEGGKFTEFKGSYNEYLALKKVQKAKDEAPMPAVTAKPNENFKSKQARADEAKKRQRVKEIERRIALLEEEESALSADLADPAVTSNYTLLKEKCTRLEEIKSQTDALYEEYENLI
jgi:ATP-binding cassette subfamily F protein 3